VAKADLAISYSHMIAVMGKSDDLAGAHQFFDKAFAIYSAQLEKAPDDSKVFMTIRATYARMADALLDLKHPDEALAYANKSVETADRVVSLGSRPDTRRFKAHSVVQRAKIEALLGQWSAARADYEESLKLLDTIPENAALPMDTTKRDEATGGLAQCEAALASAAD
jgi:tetratricopeptide (TPR) repeat protein